MSDEYPPCLEGSKKRRISLNPTNLTQIIVRRTIIARHLRGYCVVVNDMPFLIKFARLPMDKGDDSGMTGSEQIKNEKSQARLSDTFVTKVDRETTDDR